MANYTISIMDKLLEHSNGNSLRDYNVLLNASKNVLFGDELNMISETYRDHFALGFALHFFKDEIGLETWPLWQISLMEKMYNNYDYINEIYGLLDKQIFANYRVDKNTNNKSDNSEDIETFSNSSTSSDVNVSDNERNSTDKTDTTSSNTETRNLTNVNKTTNVGENDVDGNHTSEEHVKNNNETDVTNTSKDIVTSSNTSKTTDSNESTVKHTGSDNTKNTGTQTTSNNNSTDTSHTDNSENKTTQKVSDTPQNGLSPIDAGTYLSAATLADGTTSNSSNDLSVVKGTTSREDDLTTSTTHDTTDTTTVSGEVNNEGTNDSTSTVDGSSKTLIENTTDSNGLNKDIVKTTFNDELNSNETNTGNVKDEGLSNVTNILTDSNKLNSKLDRTGNDSGNKNNKHTDSSTSETNDISYDWNYEMLMKSETLLSRVWSIFDDLFYLML